MRLSSLLASIGGVKPSRTSSARRGNASKRALRVESLESRVPPSALAVLLDFDASEQTDVALRLAIDELTVPGALDCAMTVGTVEAGVETSYLPVLQPTAQGVEIDSSEPLYDTQLNDMVMGMGPAAWQSVAPTGDSGEMVLASSLSGPAPSMPGEPISAAPITVDAPDIIAFKADPGMYGWWHLKGQVVYEQPRELKVVFGGAVTGETHVTGEGIFNHSVQLPPGTSGAVTAQAFTPASVGSNIEYDWII